MLVFEAQTVSQYTRHAFESQHMSQYYAPLECVRANGVSMLLLVSRTVSQYTDTNCVSVLCALAICLCKLCLDSFVCVTNCVSVLCALAICLCKLCLDSFVCVTNCVSV